MLSREEVLHFLSKQSPSVETDLAFDASACTVHLLRYPIENSNIDILVELEAPSFDDLAGITAQPT